MSNKIALIGKFNPDRLPHRATLLSIEHANKNLGLEITAEWVLPEDVDSSLFDKYSAIWIAPGPYKDKEFEKVLWAIKYAENMMYRALVLVGDFNL